MQSLMPFFFSVFDLVFDFWPALLLSSIESRKSGIKTMVYAWVFWAIIRIILFFNPDPINKSFLIPEPLSTTLFFITGFVLIAIWFIWDLLKSRKMRVKAFGLSARDLLDLSPGEFEEMTVELYRAYGHQAKRTGASGDHGVDVVVKSKSGKKMIVQCKRWRKPVGESIVRDFYGTMQHEKAAHGTIIATSGFTQQAIEWARGKPMNLHDGEKFIRLWREYRNKNQN